MSQSDGGDTYAAGSATQGKQTCLFCQAAFTGKKGSKFCSKACYHDLQKANCKQPFQIASCLTQGSVPDIGDQEIFSTPNVRPQSKRPLSADSSIEETLSEPKKLRYEDLTSITEDKELSHLDSLSKDVISAKLGAALDFVRLQHERITKLESELLNAKIAFANSVIAQFNPQQTTFSNSQAPPTPGLTTRPSYAQAARVQHAPVLVANFAKGCAPADRVSLEKMEQLLDSHAGGPVPSSVRQKDSTVFVRLNNPADFDRAKTILESKQNSDRNNMSDSKSYSSFRSAFPPTNETQDENHAFSPGVIDNSFSFSEKTIRMAFIRKVYAILMVQLAVTMGCIAVFVFVQPIALYSKGHPQLMIGALVMSIVLLIPLICCIDFRRRWPLNIIMLGTFTLCEGFLLGSLSSHYDSKEVLVAAGICTAVCLALTLFSMQTKWDFTAMGGILLALVVVLLMAGIVAICVRGKIMQIIYASLGALVFSAYLVFDTQLMLGGKHKYSISPEEYIFAALNLYLDIVNIFIYVLALVGGSK